MKRFVPISIFIFQCFIVQKVLANHFFEGAKNANILNSNIVDTLPTVFEIKWILNINNEKHILKLQYQKNPNDSSLHVTCLNNDTIFPQSFYKTLESYFELTPYLSSGTVYSDMYQKYKSKGFTDNTHISYSKEPYGTMTAKTIYVYDIDNDNIPEIFISDKENSSTDNDVYELYQLDKQLNRFVRVAHFFNGAFFGWDKTKKYIITGESNTRERHLIKNKIANCKLIPIKKCTTVANQVNTCF